MRKFILFLCISFLSLTAAAAYDKIDTSLHGANLKKASFVIRYKFEQKHHKSWQSSTFEERKLFLNQWYIDLGKKEKQARSEAKEIAARERAIYIQKRGEKKRLEDLAKIEKRAMLDEHRGKKNNMNKINREVKTMEKELKLLK